ncbi:SURF1 family protein [Hyphococcus sp.]|uniref:SURF1 family protein n=1 Tax=Hyphococcus sp. TaxID=2038636 RepID=UPI003CCBB532
MATYRFQFRPVLTMCVMLALGLLVSLGIWQLQRLEWKRDLISKVDARISAEPIPFSEAERRANSGEDMRYTPVSLAGVLDFDNTAIVFGANDGRVGAFYFTPLKIAECEFIYVNRGFAPQSINPAPVAESSGPSVTGLFRYAERLAPPASWFRSREQSGDGLWFVRDPTLFAEKAGIATAAYYIDQFAVPERQWPQGGTTRIDFSNRHFEYALTWFGLGVALIGVWCAFSLQKQ